MVDWNGEGGVLVHAHVECRGEGRSWWRYAQPLLPYDRALFQLLSGGAEHEHDLVPSLGVPQDISDEVRDVYTLRVAGEFVDADEPRAISKPTAAQWLGSGRAKPWPTREPFYRMVDPTIVGATYLDAHELDRVLTIYESEQMREAPATYSALLEMMSELEREYEVRLVLWFEPLSLKELLDQDEQAASRPTVPLRQPATSDAA